MVALLAGINELGFVTDDSQPGVPLNESGYGQRAYLDGMCDEQTAWQLSGALHGLDIVVIGFPPGEGGSGQIVVTLDGWSENTWCGIHRPAGYSHLYEPISPELNSLVDASWTVQLVDPVWGRSDYLFQLVLLALGGDPDAAR